jgi:hypothetical protein
VRWERMRGKFNRQPLGSPVGLGGRRSKGAHFQGSRRTDPSRSCPIQSRD